MQLREPSGKAGISTIHREKKIKVSNSLTNVSASARLYAQSIQVYVKHMAKRTQRRLSIVQINMDLLEINI